MRPLLLAILLIILVSDDCGCQTIRLENRYFLWDVTLSMKGKAYQTSGEPTPNIWQAVKDSLVEAIDRTSDPSTKLFVIPFQDDVIKVWSAKADKEGKRDLINKVKGFNSDIKTHTNICAAWDEVLQLVDYSRSNTIIMMTDGFQNSPRQPLDCLLNKINIWCEQANSFNGYAFYVMLTKAARNPALEAAIEQCDKIETIPGGSILFNDIRPSSDTYYVNIKEIPLLFELELLLGRNEPLPPDFSMDLNLPTNEYFSIEPTKNVKFENQKCMIKIIPHGPRSQLETNLPEEFTTTVSIDKHDNTYSNIHLTKRDFNLVIMNKREKILNIYVKEKEF